MDGMNTPLMIGAIAVLLVTIIISVVCFIFSAPSKPTTEAPTTSVFQKIKDATDQKILNTN